ncbi:MAG: DMP19 family protein [Allosphingosinicella sp.]
MWSEGSPLRSQGLLAPEILVAKADRRSRDPDTLVDAVIGFCNWCTEEAGLIREEVQPDAWTIYHSSYYIAQVHNGGHGQFAGNSGMKPKVLDDVETGLARLGLGDLLAIFGRFRRALDGSPALKRKAMEGGGFGDIPDLIREVDHAYFDSPEPERFNRQAAQWLKGAPTVAALTPREIRARKREIVASNRLIERRRASETRRSPRRLLVDSALRLWDATGLRRPGESWYEQLRRRVAVEPNPSEELDEAFARLIDPFYDSVQDADHEGVDAILAAYRDLHARHRLEEKPRWPDYIRTYATRLLYAGDRMGRPDLLEQAADAWGRVLVLGPPSNDYDPGVAWRSLAQALVALARLDERQVPAVSEALDALERALDIDSARDPGLGCRADDILGRAEAHLVLATREKRALHLRAAQEALGEARPWLRRDKRGQWRALDAERLALSPPVEVGAHDRSRALRGLDIEIVRESEEEGSPRAHPMRLKRLRRLRATLADGSERSA